MTTPDCCEALAWLKGGLPIVAIVASVVTWWVTQQRTKHSAKRNEAKSDIVKLKDRLDIVHQRAYQYHRGAEGDSDLATEIHVLLKIFSGDLDRFSILDGYETSLLLIRLRQAITLENFETDQFEEKKLDDPLLESIDLACDHIKSSLDSAFSKKFG